MRAGRSTNSCAASARPLVLHPSAHGFCGGLRGGQVDRRIRAAKFRALRHYVSGDRREKEPSHMSAGNFHRIGQRIGRTQMARPRPAQSASGAPGGRRLPSASSARRRRVRSWQDSSRPNCRHTTRPCGLFIRSCGCNRNCVWQCPHRAASTSSGNIPSRHQISPRPMPPVSHRPSLEKTVHPLLPHVSMRLPGSDLAPLGWDPRVASHGTGKGDQE